jgi:hypothetical protein
MTAKAFGARTLVTVGRTPVVFGVCLYLIDTVDVSLMARGIHPFHR